MMNKLWRPQEDSFILIKEAMIAQSHSYYDRLRNVPLKVLRSSKNESSNIVVVHIPSDYYGKMTYRFYFALEMVEPAGTSNEDLLDNVGQDLTKWGVDDA
jgi:hypothetical protein